MSQVLLFVLGVVAGGVAVFAVLDARRRRVNALELGLATEQMRLDRESEALETRRIAENQKLATDRATLQEEAEKQRAELDQRRQEVEAKLRQVISYSELEQENLALKRDLQNVDVSLRKQQLDQQILQQIQEDTAKRVLEVSERFLDDTVAWVSKSLTPNNFANSKKKILKVIGWCRDIGFDISDKREADYVSALQEEFERVVRAAVEREEQMRIKAQIREEQKLEREIEKELKRLETERKAIQVALEKALAEAKDEHNAEIESLRARLAEAESNTQRAMSRAQMTKSGHVYVISNIGSFGEGVYKIGMTRRLEPIDRVKELGDASVPFRFDVHMMISSDDAPTLENALHREFHHVRLNKVNHRKEFFRVDLEDVRRIVEAKHGEVSYVADAEALEYRQSLEMSDEDLEYVEHVFEEAEADMPDVDE